MLRVLYLVHDLSDPAVRRRVLMLHAGGASVTLAGFRRGENRLADIEGVTPIDLGATGDARFAQRIVAVAGAAATLSRRLSGIETPDVILARNLETLALTGRAAARFGDVPVAYECLDIHRLMLRNGMVGRALRGAERHFGRKAGLVVTSSPAFVEHYFKPLSGIRAPVHLLENQVLELDGDAGGLPARTRPAGGPWRIGWFGAIRCRKSLDLLSAFTRRMAGRFEVVLRGRPAHGEFEDFDGRIAREPFIRFEGPYRNPEDLAAIYGAVDFTWAIDFFEEGRNSLWLLPNRLYEGCRHGALPIVLDGTETARLARQRGVGVTLANDRADTLFNRFADFDGEAYGALYANLVKLGTRPWVLDRADCAAFVQRLAALRQPSAPAAAFAPPFLPSSQTRWIAMTADAAASVRCLIVIPCLNEARYLEPLVRHLEPTLSGLAATLVVVDGGSTDGTREIALRLAASVPNMHVLDNPKRIQSAAINLAVATFGVEHDYLIRIDAHGTYPDDYCRVLVEDALETGADSVVVAMQTVGFGTFQKATAVAQNSVLGNGGAKHRAGAESHWADHGHHALMRISAFRAVGGYDETFTANEDAEYDYRLRQAGYRIWMTARTSMVYYPRDSVLPLFRQYFGYGRGRARNVLKHRSRPGLRQLLPLMVAPVAAGAFLAAITWIAAVPFVLWAAACMGYGAWMALGQRNPYGPLAAVSAMIMHFAWSAGFWREVLDFRSRRALA